MPGETSPPPPKSPPWGSNSCSPNPSCFPKEISHPKPKSPNGSPWTSGPRRRSHTASFHSPRAFKSWPARPGSSRGPPAGPSKKATDRQVAPDSQPTVQRAGRGIEAPRGTSRDSLPDGGGPILGRSFSAPSPRRTGKRDTPTLLGNVSGRGTTDARTDRWTGVGEGEGEHS